MSDDADRALPATPRRLAKARAQGQIVRSAAAAAALTLAGGAAVTATLEPAATWWVGFARESAFRAATVSHASAAELSADVVEALRAPAPWAVIACAWVAAMGAVLIAAIACGGLTPAWAALRMDAARISWAAGVKKLGTLDGLGAVVALCGAIAIASASAAVVSTWAGIAADGAGLRPNMAALGDALADLWRRATPILAMVAVADVAVQRRRSARSLRMTPREVKEERADNEGRPEIKARRHHAAAKHARGLNIKAIKRATAVVTNPTHLAVALRYAPPEIEVPVVVARGADLSAALVRGAAESYGVPIVEAPELARLLFERAEAGAQIPEEAFVAVAAVFAWILRTRGTLPGANDAEDGLS